MSNKNWVSQIKHHRKKVYSQCGEEGFIEFILQNIGIDINSMSIVEFGAGDGVSLSNSKYFIDKGAKAFRYDGDNKGNESVQRVWLDLDQIQHIAIVCNATQPCNVLMIDVDGNDLWFIECFLNTIDKKPELIICEINSIFKRDESYAMPYNAHHSWKNNDYYGMSIAAAESLMDANGYTLVFVNDSLNAYFVRRKLVEGQEIEIEYKVKKDHPHDAKSYWVKNYKTEKNNIHNEYELAQYN